MRAQLRDLIAQALINKTTAGASVFEGVITRSLKTAELPAISVRTPESDVEPIAAMGEIGARDLERRQRVDIIITERENNARELENRLDLIAEEVEGLLLLPVIALDNWYLIGEETEVLSDDGDNLFGFHTLSYVAVYTTNEGTNVSL